MKTERLIVKYQSRTVVNGKYFTTRRFDISPDGEHATSVNSTSRPAYDDFLAVGIKAKIPPTRCRELYEQVRENLIIHTSDRR